MALRVEHEGESLPLRATSHRLVEDRVQQMTLTGAHAQHDAGRSAKRGRPHCRGARPVFLTLCALALAGTIAVVTSTAATTGSQGPLTTEDDPAVDSGVGVPSLRTGQSFCYGSTVIVNTSKQEATLESLRISGGDGLTIGSALVLGPSRSTTLATADRCPATASPLKGYVVRARAGTGEDLGVEVMFPIRIDRPGKSRIEEVTVTYRVGDKFFEVSDTDDVVACTYDCEAEPGGR
jgi:hypothetical protein